MRELQYRVRRKMKAKVSLSSPEYELTSLHIGPGGPGGPGEAVMTMIAVVAE